MMMAAVRLKLPVLTARIKCRTYELLAAGSTQPTCGNTVLIAGFMKRALIRIGLTPNILVEGVFTAS